MSQSRRTPALRGLAALLALAMPIRPALAGAADAAPPAGELAPVVVTTDKLSVETLIDRKVYSARADLQSTFGSAADLLAVIPSVDIDPEGVLSLRGDSNVLILVDGHPSTLFSGPAAADNLQAFPASQIERIEILTVPPAQFKVDGTAGIINIVTRRRPPAGLTGTVQTSRGNDGREVLGSDLSDAAGPLNVTVSVGYRRDMRQRSVQSDLVTPAAGPAPWTDNRSTLDENISRASEPLGIRLQYAPDERRSVEATFSSSDRNASREYAQWNDTLLAAGVFAGAAQRFSAGQDHEADTDALLSFTQHLARTGETLDLSAHRSVSHEAEHYDYLNVPLLPPAAGYRDNLGFRDVEIDDQLDAGYVLPVSKTRTLKLGYAFEKEDYGYDAAGGNVDPRNGAQVPDPQLTDDFRFTEQIHALYASYQAIAGPWNWLYGLRGELARTGTRPTGELLTASYLRAYPSLHVERSLTDVSTLSFGASRRITRPDPADLDPYIDHEYTPNLHAGNPYLRPQYTQSVEAGYSRDARGSSLSATVYYRRNTDATTFLVENLGQGVTLNTRANLPRSDSAGLEFTASGHITQRLEASASGNLFYSQIDASALGLAGLRSTTGLNGKLRLDWRPAAADQVQLTATRTDRRLTPQGYVTAIDVVNVGYRRQLARGLSLVMTLSDLFDGQHYERVATTPAFSETYVRRVRGRVGYLGIVCTLGSRPGGKPAKFEFEPAGAD